MKLSEILRERGYVYQHSSEALEEITDGTKRTLYLGIDPTADSMHIGHLMGLLVLRRFLEDGHKVIILTGGGTGMIGDPGGKSSERNLLDEETIAHNAKSVAAQIRKVFGANDFIEENNAKWLSKLNLIDFLREIGKHFTVNAMIKKDIVKNRLDAESPISFTEFSYSLLQGYDFLHLKREYSCDVQVGGSDQWSNILAGVDFIRRKENETVYAFTWPLLIDKTTGRKFGKSEGGNTMWLDAEKTSPYQLYQFCFNMTDDAVEELLLKLTLLDVAEISSILQEHKENPAARVAQRALAYQVTAIVHGEEAAKKEKDASSIRFKDPANFSEEDIESLKNGPTVSVSVGMTIVDALIAASLATSKREARQFIEDKAVYIGQDAVTDVSAILEEKYFTTGVALLRRGKRNIAVLIVA